MTRHAPSSREQTRAYRPSLASAAPTRAAASFPRRALGRALAASALASASVAQAGFYNVNANSDCCNNPGLGPNVTIGCGTLDDGTLTRGSWEIVCADGGGVNAFFDAWGPWGGSTSMVWSVCYNVTPDVPQNSWFGNSPVFTSAEAANNAFQGSVRVVPVLAQNRTLDLYTCDSANGNSGGVRVQVRAKPDLEVPRIDLSQVVAAVNATNGNLEISGTLVARVRNVGPGATTANFTVLFFEDRNANGAFDAGTDATIATVVRAGLTAQTSVDLTAAIPANTTVQAQGNLIYALADSTNVVASEGNVGAPAGHPVGDPNPTVNDELDNYSLGARLLWRVDATIGGSASFSVPTVPAGTTYQWRNGAANLADGNGVSGSTTSLVTFNPVALAHRSMLYNCEYVTGARRATTNNAELRVQPDIDFCMSNGEGTAICRADTRWQVMLRGGAGFDVQRVDEENVQLGSATCWQSRVAMAPYKEDIDGDGFDDAAYLFDPRSAPSNGGGCDLAALAATGLSLKGSLDLDGDGTYETTFESYPQTVAVDATCGFDFASATITNFDNEGGTGTATVEDGGRTLALANNTWKKVPLSYTVTANTVVRLRFKSTVKGECHAIGLDENNTKGDQTRYFKLYGTSTVSGLNTSNFNTYASFTSGEWISYTIPIGKYYTGAMSHLVLINDHDASPANATSWFSDVRVLEYTY